MVRKFHEKKEFLMKISKFKYLPMTAFCFFIALLAVSHGQEDIYDNSMVRHDGRPSRAFRLPSPAKMMVLALVGMSETANSYGTFAEICRVCSFSSIDACINGYLTQRYVGCQDRCLDCPGWEHAKEVHDNIWVRFPEHIKNR